MDKSNSVMSNSRGGSLPGLDCPQAGHGPHAPGNPSAASAPQPILQRPSHGKNGMAGRGGARLLPFQRRKQCNRSSECGAICGSRPCVTGTGPSRPRITAMPAHPAVAVDVGARCGPTAGPRTGRIHRSSFASDLRHGRLPAVGSLLPMNGKSPAPHLRGRALAVQAGDSPQARSKRSAFITLVQAATKSFANFSRLSSCA